MIHLTDIAACANGFTFRKKPRNSRTGNVRVVQIGDVEADGTFDPHTCAKVDMPEPDGKFLLHKDDLIFRGRGAFAAALVPNHDKPVMAASPLIWIRPDRRKVDPAYLAWFINGPEAQRFFMKAGQGSIVKAVGVRELAQLKIPLPPLEKQRQIVEAANLLEREQRILHTLSTKREQLVTALLMHHATGETDKTDQKERKRA